MRARARLESAAARLFAACTLSVLVLAACGGQTAGASAADGGTSGAKDASLGDDAGSTGPEGATGVCVDVDPSTFTITCTQDSDCTSVTTGTVCTGSCDCGGNTAINQSSLADYQSEISAVQFSSCPCPEGPVPRCVSQVCAECGVPGTCPDAGSEGAPDASGDGPTCVTLTPAQFDNSCNTASDCVYVTTGTLCTGSCDCGDTYINDADEEAYQDAVAGIQFAGCPCAPHPQPSCIGGKCSSLVAPP